MATEDDKKAMTTNELSRRDVLRNASVVAAGMAAAATTISGCSKEVEKAPPAQSAAVPAQPATAAATPEACVPKNPYGGGPGTGISLPPYFKPTDSIKNNNVYYPGTEELGKDEMRISFVGSCPFPPRIDQAGTSIMVECGPDKRFFFDFGSGCLRNIVGMQVPVQMVNDIFLTHLHIDHYADLPYMFGFAPWLGRFKPLRVHGPSGRTPEDGTKAMIEGMKKMAHWHIDSFSCMPIGDGY